MSLYYYGPGNWRIGNFRLPELGATEGLLGGKRQSLNSSELRKIIDNIKASSPTTDDIYNKSGGGNSASNQSSATNYNYSGSVNNNPRQNYIRDLRNEVDTGESDLQSLREQIRDQANAMYKSAERNYKSRLGELEDTRNEMQGVLESSYNDQLKRIEGGRQAQIEQLDNTRGVVDTNQKNTFRELASNTANALQAANQRLGAYGASDSSATNMYGYALGKQANKLRSNALQQFNQQRVEIEQNKEAVIRDAEQRMREASTWFANKKLELGQYIKQLRNNLQDALAQVDNARKWSQIEEIQNEYNRVSQKVAQAESIYQQARASLVSQAQEQLGRLNDYATRLANQYGVEVEEVTPGNIDMGTEVSGPQQKRTFVPGLNDDDKLIEEQRLGGGYSYGIS